MQDLSRRGFLGLLTCGAAGYGLLRALPLASGTAPPAMFSPQEEALLDDIERAGALYFWEAANPLTGIVKDRSRADG
ncbi:MAG TPA: hypothetical protein VL382_05640, partial [Terriglobales bacterium]|nr:hypothetical protein [Terriglobales bacterium]